jgi:hypothetical protein
MGAPHRGEKGTHGMRACLLHSCAWVRDCVVDRRAVMHACVRDRGAWRRPCMADRHALMHLWDEQACMCAHLWGEQARMCARLWGEQARICACLWVKQSRLGGKADGCKTHLFWRF